MYDMSNRAVQWLSPLAALVGPLLAPCLASLVLHLPGKSIVSLGDLLLAARGTRIHQSASIPSRLAVAESDRVGERWIDV